MGDLIRNHPALVAIALLTWLSYGPYSTEPPQAKGATKPAVLDLDKLETRPSGQRAVAMRSPFQPEVEPPEPGRRNDLPAAGMWLVSPLKSASAAWQVTHAEMGFAHVAGAVLVRALMPGGGGLEAGFQAHRSLADVELPGGGESPDFSLTLESMVAFGGGDGRARISGRSVVVGGEIHGFDPVSPPVLLAVHGLWVVIEHRGEEVTLDLDGRSTAAFGPHARRP